MDNQNNIPEYLTDFNNFMATYHRGEVSGEEVGELIARMAQHYAKYNLETVAKERRLSLVAKENESKSDENGKPISSTKAKVYTEATDEMADFNLSRAHLQNIEQMINSLKALQKGVLNEYQAMALT